MANNWISMLSPNIPMKTLMEIKDKTCEMGP